MGSAMKAILDKKYNDHFGIITPTYAFKENLLPYLKSEKINIQNK